VFTYDVKRHIVDAPTVRIAPATVLTAAQIGRFLTFAADDGYAPLWLLLQTGLRRGEGSGLRWQDIDLDKGKLSVRQCVEAIGGLPRIQTPKTTAARRTISLFP